MQKMPADFLTHLSPHMQQLKLRLPADLKLESTHVILLSISLLVVVFLAIRSSILKWSQHRYCAYGDLKTAGTPSPGPKKQTAVIIGASISGILSGMLLEFELKPLCPCLLR